MPTYQITTLGCKVNHYESLQIEELLRREGYSPAKEDSKPDLIIVNTCSVTQAAAAKSRNLLRRYSRDGHSPKVIAIGCWTTSNLQAAAAIVGETGVLTHQDHICDRLVELFRNRPAVFVPDGRQGTSSLPLLTFHQPENQRAILKVQDGCDAHCTYCIIPKLRPILWSKPADDVVREARQLVNAGHHEIVITGVFLGAYNQNTALHRRQNKNDGLALLIPRLCEEVYGLTRLRLSSLEPGDVTDGLIAQLKKYRQIMPHFHLPLQSGSSTILRKMNRQYSASDYIDMVDRLVAAFDRPAITTDIIVGFPEETDVDFEQTLEIARRVRFLHMHCFPFSPREGTAAARWSDHFVHQQIITDRMAILNRLNDELSQQFRSQFRGESAEILVEKPAAGKSDVFRHGRCEHYFDIHFTHPKAQTGQILKLKITRISSRRTFGEIIENGI